MCRIGREKKGVVSQCYDFQHTSKPSRDRYKHYVRLDSECRPVRKPHLSFTKKSSKRNLIRALSESICHKDKVIPYIDVLVKAAKRLYDIHSRIHSSPQSSARSDGDGEFPSFAEGCCQVTFTLA